MHAGGVVCAKINLVRYKLDLASATCYYGSGQSGGMGAVTCPILPSATAIAMVRQYGTDVCVPSPFGGVMSYIRGKNCASMGASVLKFSDTGLPVPMFK